MSTAQVDSIYTLEKLTMYAVKDMEDYGCRVDVPYLKEQQIALTKELKGLEEDTQLIAPGINAESPSQIVKFFLDNNVAIPEKDGTTSDDDEDGEDDPYEEAQPSRINRMYPDRLGLFKGTPKSAAKKSQETEEKKSYSVDKKVLSEIDHPLAVCVLRHRKLTKFKSSYVDTILDFQDNEVIRPNFRTLKARTGRLSCVDPALQTIPKDKDVAGEAMTYEQGLSIRRTFIPRPNCWLVPIDYSQQEFRLFVHYAKNKQLTDRYKAGDFDFHDVVAEMTGLSRTDAKTCTFGILYGMGDKKLANRLKCTLKEAERIKAKYFRNVAGAEDLIKLTMNTAKARGYVRTLYGRPRFLYYRNRLGVQVDECHKALNTIIQGGCADIMKIMLVKINKFLKYRDGVPYTYPYGVRIILTIHDEIILEVPYGQEGIIPAIKTTLEYIPQVNVPMVAEVSLCEHDWSDKKKVTPEMLDEWRKKPVKVLPPYTVDPYIIHPFMEYEDYPKIGLFANL